MNQDQVFLSADDILEKPEFKRMVVHVPEWGGNIILQELDGEEAVRYAQIKDKMAGMARLVFLSCVKPDGTRLFTMPAQLEKLARKGFSTLKKLQYDALLLNGLREAPVSMDREKAEQVRAQLETLIAKGGGNVEELKEVLLIVQPLTEDEAAKND